MARTQTAAPFYRYEVEVHTAGEAPSLCSVIYCATEEVNVTRLADELNTLIDDRLIPDRIILLGREPLLKSMQTAANHERIVEMIPQTTRFHRTPAIEIVAFDHRGQLSSYATGENEDSATQRWEPAETTKLLQAGLRRMMKDRGVVLTTNGYHFAKPSTRHSNRFIRTANALRYGSEVSFIAANLLHLIPTGGFDRVYTDTSSINAVAYALKDHLRAFDPASEDFTIDSFGSHLGVDGDYNLSGSDRALVLISASTSGGLVEKMRYTQDIEIERMITLCYVGDQAIPNVVCDLTLRDGNDLDDNLAELHLPFPNWDGADCPDCDRGYSLVVITGDQFLPASPSISIRDVKREHAPRWLNKVCRQLTGLDVFRCHATAPTDSEPRALYLDFAPVIELAKHLDPASEPKNEHEQLAQQVLRRILRDVPAGTKWIVHLDDDASRQLAALANRHLASVGSPVAENDIVSARELIESPELYQMQDGLVLVVASAIASGRSITSVSQALRIAHGDNPITYLILAGRTPTKARTKAVVSNLGYGNGSFGEHHVSVLLELALPGDREGTSSPWAHETTLWRKVRDEIADPDASPTKVSWLNERIAVLEQTDGKDLAAGKTDDIFLRNRSEASPLRLQPNFAFWDFEYESDKVAQSEVFFVATSILHHMRGELNLLQSGAHEHNWTVLDPSILARFNDPVIQAAFLRAARPHELDYTGQPEYSRDMAAILKPLILNWDKADGGAAAEILLALVVGRLSLVKEDVATIRDLLDPNVLPEPLASLAQELFSTI